MALRTAALIAAAALAVLAGPAAAQTGSVLVVGDSLGVGTEPHLRAALPDVKIEADVRTGRPSKEGLTVLHQIVRPDHDVIVFDLGTNDDPGNPSALKVNLIRASEEAGGRCLVIATLNKPPLNGIPVDGLNDAIEQFAATSPTTVVVDWLAATARPGVLAPDGVHGTPAGYALRGKLVAEAVASCLAPLRKPPDAGPPQPEPAVPRARRPPKRNPAPAPVALPGLLGQAAELVHAAAIEVIGAISPRPPDAVLGAG